MLLTNGAATSRELYSPGFLTTITAFINNAVATAQFPTQGVAMVTMRTRFAGLHRPDVTQIPRSPQVAKLDESDRDPQEDLATAGKEASVLEKQLSALKALGFK